MFKKFLLAIMVFMCVSQATWSQDTLRGRIQNSDGLPLGGASIRLGKGGETLSDAKGYFVLSVKNGLPDSLLVSYVGYQTQRRIINTTQELVSIAMQSTNAVMEEVIVSTGFQRVSKERLTGSVVSVNNELINRTAGTTILDRLDGVTPGLLFDKRNPAEPRLQIRGLFTLSEAISQPLIVVDNFPFEGSIEEINPNDVEDVTILRDAAAASIWGARAGNGVIVITTKKGGPSQKPKLSASGATTITGKPRLMTLPILGSKEVIELERDLFNKGAYNAMERDIYSPLNPLQELLFAHRRGEITDRELETEIEKLEQRDVRRDFLEHVYRPSIRQQYALQISGGGGGARYFVSGGYDRNQSELIGAGDERVTLRSNLNWTLTKKLDFTFGFNQTYSRTVDNSLGGFRNSSYSYGSRAMPIYGSLQDDGIPTTIPIVYQRRFTDTAGGGRLRDWTYRPLEERTLIDRGGNQNSTIINLGAQYKIINGLQMNFRYQHESGNGIVSNFYGRDSYFARNLINTYSQIQGNGVRNVIPDNGILDRFRDQRRVHNARLQFDYQRKIGQSHEISLIAGGEIRERKENRNSNRVYGYDKNLMSTSLIDYVTFHRTMLGFTMQIPNVQGESQLIDRFISGFGNLSYTYKDQVTLYGSLRRDASNLFGRSINQQGKPFWSTGTRWQLNKASFFSSRRIESFFLQASYGFSGNVNNQGLPFTVINYGGASSNAPSNLPFASISEAPNPRLKWEEVATINFGAGLTAFKNKIRVQADFFMKKSKDVYALTPNDPTTGFSSLRANSANIEGKGVDIQIETNITLPGKIQWNGNFAISHADYTVTNFLIQTNTNGFFSNGNSITPRKGLHPYLVVSFPWAGLNPENGNPQGFLDGRPSSDYGRLLQNPFENQIIHGPGLAPWFGNFLNRFRLKSFELSFNLAFEFGHYYRRDAVFYSAFFNSGFAPSDIAKRWKVPGDEKVTNIPSMIYPNPTTQRELFYQRSEVHVIKKDFIRIRDLRFQYSIKVKNSTINLFAICSGFTGLLWTANKLGVDPERDNLGAPSSTYSLGANFQF
jgi:TonB-linked SusC/RagA family outer membrane protein